MSLTQNEMISVSKRLAFFAPEGDCLCLRRRPPLSQGHIVFLCSRKELHLSQKEAALVSGRHCLCCRKGLPQSQKSLRCAPGRQSSLPHRETACVSGTNRFSLFQREIAFFLQGDCWRLGEIMSEQDFFCLREKSLLLFRNK